MQAPEPDYYRILGITQTATPGDIKKAYYRLAKIHHPDKKAPGETVDAADFRKINDAYEFLKEPRRRAQYDGRYRSVQIRGTQYRAWVQAQANQRIWQDRVAAQRRADEEATKKRKAAEEMREASEALKRRIDAMKRRAAESAQDTQSRVAREAEEAKTRQEVWVQTVLSFQYRPKPSPEETKRAAEAEQRAAEDARKRKAAESEAERLRKAEESKSAAWNSAWSSSSTKMTSCSHQRLGQDWQKNGKGRCSFCDIHKDSEETWCFHCPDCSVAVCIDCKNNSMDID